MMMCFNNLIYTVILPQLLLFNFFANSSSVYKLDSNQAYEWKRNFPQSCKCVQNLVSSSKCSLYECTCTCDITAGECDYSCCCDPDCSSDQISRFKSLDVCMYEGSAPSSIQYCYSSSELYAVNPRDPMGGDSTVQEAVGGALCVQKKNQVFEEEYYVNVDLQSVDIFSDSDGQKEFSYSTAELSSDTPDDYFDRNDTIAAFLNVSNVLYSNGPGLWQLPLPAFDSSCNDMNFIKFEVDVDSTSCERVLSNHSSIFSSQCNNLHSIDRYVNNLFVSKSASLVASDGDASFSDVVSISINSIDYFDYEGGSSHDITSKWQSNNCNTNYYNNSLYTSTQSTLTNKLLSCSSYSSSYQLKYLLNSSAICQNFVQSVVYTINHTATATGTIMSIIADITVTDIPFQSSSSPIVVMQSFGVSFKSSNGNPSQTDGNLVERQRSGNPGYLLGKPVLFGSFVDNGDNDYIQETVEGLTIPSPFTQYNIHNPSSFGASICPNSIDYINSIPINFGYDVSTGCMLELTRQELINLCCTGSESCGSSVSFTDSPYVNTNGIPFFFSNFSTGYVGEYGSSDPLDVSQWFAMTYTKPSTSPSWTEKTATCSNMYTGLSIEFLVAYVGAKNNPQNKIVSALATLTTSNLKVNIPYGDTESTQKFPLQLTVSFIFKNENAIKGYYPPAPPVLFKVPYDVFYPFLKFSGAKTSHLNYAELWLVGVISLVSAVSLVW
eukprot:gene5656-7811_t